MANSRTLEEVLRHAASSRDMLEAHSATATREHVIRPAIDALGWSVLDLHEVVPEFKVSDGTKVDYCLLLNGTPQVLVEVKSAGTGLDKHEQQLVNYAFQEGAPIAVLTNGFEWHFFLPRAPDKWHERLFRTVVVEESPRAPAAAIREVLARKAIANGSAQQAAQSDLDQLARESRFEAALPVAWERLDIVKQLQDEIEAKTGDRPRKPDLVKLLRDHLSGGTSSSATRRPGSRLSPSTGDGADAPAVPETPRKNRPSTKAQAFWLDGKRYAVSHWKHILAQVCDLLINEKGENTFRELVAGDQRTTRLFSQDAQSFKFHAVVGSEALYVQTHMNAKNFVRKTRDVIKVVRGSDAGFRTEPEL